MRIKSFVLHPVAKADCYDACYSRGTEPCSRLTRVQCGGQLRQDPHLSRRHWWAGTTGGHAENLCPSIHASIYWRRRHHDDLCHVFRSGCLCLFLRRVTERIGQAYDRHHTRRPPKLRSLVFLPQPLCSGRHLPGQGIDMSPAHPPRQAQRLRVVPLGPA